MINLEYLSFMSSLTGIVAMLWLIWILIKFIKDKITDIEFFVNCIFAFVILISLAQESTHKEQLEHLTKIQESIDGLIELGELKQPEKSQE